MKVTVTGDNQFLIAKTLSKYTAGFKSTYGDIAFEKIDAEESSYERITESMQSLPFLAQKKMVVLRSPSALKEFTQNAEKLLNGLPSTTELIIYEPKLDKRTSYAKQLKKITDYQEFKQLEENGLLNWLVEESDGKMARKQAGELLKKIGLNQQMLANELQKLLSTEKAITSELINSMVEPLPQSTIFELLDSAFSGNKKKTLEIYNDQRRQNVEPQAIIGLLSWQLHVVALCVTADGRNTNEIAKEAKINPYVVTKSMRIAQNLNKRDIKEYVSKLTKLDEQIKTSAINADDALIAYLLSL